MLARDRTACDGSDDTLRQALPNRRMRRFKARFEYHGSRLIAASWTGGGDLQLTIDLDGQWNGGLSLRICVIFYGVGNRAEVEGALAEITSAEPSSSWLADITGLRRTSEGCLQLDTSRGSLAIESESFAEV